VIRSGWKNALPRRLVVPGRLALVAAAALIPLLAGCEAGNNAPTLDFHYPTDAAGTQIGKLSIRNVFIVGAPLGSSLAPGQSASLFLALVNLGKPDRLLSISAPGSASAVVLPGGSIAVNTRQPVYLSGPRPKAYLVGLTRTLTSGSDIKLVLHFRKAGPVTLMVPIFAKAAHYVTYSPPPSPTPSTTGGKHHRAKHSPASGTSPTPTPSPTP
jgi:copper(I)-binding protein